jgi:predicted nucleic acid-binding protein
MARRVASGELLVAPALLLAEVAGAIARRTGRSALARRATEIIVRLPGLRLVAIDDHLGRAAAELAADLGLRGADAVYVATAAHLGIPLVTWDREQHKRAGGLVAVEIPGSV